MRIPKYRWVIDAKVAAMDNNTLLEEAFDATAVSWEDCGYSNKERYETEALRRELEKRLKETGFLT